MTPNQIRALAAAGESETLEFKHTTGTRREAAQTVCAMLNQRGGHVLFGVTPTFPCGGAAANALGLTTQVPVRPVYLTSGPNRRLRLCAQTVHLRHAPRWQLVAPHRPAGNIVRALAWLFLDRWCFRTMRSNIEPMKNIARMLRRHRELILNWFRANKQFNNGIVEGLNLKWNLTVRKAFGFRTFNALQIASFHQLGDLPEPQFTHEFY